MRTLTSVLVILLAGCGNVLLTDALTSAPKPPASGPHGLPVAVDAGPATVDGGGDSGVTGPDAGLDGGADAGDVVGQGRCSADEFGPTFEA